MKKYPTKFDSLAAFYDALYSTAPRKNRQITTPRQVTANLLAQLGQPSSAFKSILVTGSKGKGTTAILLSELIQAAGKKVGLFSSPHLFDYRERIQINQQLIPEQDLLKIAAKVLTAVNNLTIEHEDELPRFFEITTAIAYSYFAEKEVDFAVIETGIGAMTDATNQQSHCLSILTGIEKEHLDIFGSLAGIAKEKSGVIKAKTPLILGDLPEAIDQIILTRAAALEVPVTRFKRQFVPNNHGFYQLKIGQQLWISDSMIKTKNAWIALKAFQQLNLNLTDKQQLETLENARLAARQEIVSQKPFIIIDGAHTSDSAWALANYVNKLTQNRRGKKLLLLSFSAKKNIDALLSAFADTDEIILTQATAERSLAVDEIAAEISLPAKIKTIADPIKAIEKTLKTLKADDVLVITGSVYLAGLISEKFQHFNEKA